jgi:hypothetical protein
MRILRTLSRLTPLAVAAVLVTGEASGQTCYVASATSTQFQITGSSVFILNEAETEVAFNVACCGCPVTVAFLVSDNEGNLFSLSTPAGCPMQGVWNGASTVPLTPARVQDLKDGKLGILVQKTCDVGAVIGHFLLEPCDE